MLGVGAGGVWVAEGDGRVGVRMGQKQPVSEPVVVNIVVKSSKTEAQHIAGPE